MKSDDIVIESSPFFIIEVRVDFINSLQLFYPIRPIQPKYSRGPEAYFIVWMSLYRFITRHSKLMRYRKNKFHQPDWFLVCGFFQFFTEEH